MTRRLVSGAVVGALVAAFAGGRRASGCAAGHTSPEPRRATTGSRYVLLRDRDARQQRREERRLQRHRGLRAASAGAPVTGRPRMAITRMRPRSRAEAAAAARRRRRRHRRRRHRRRRPPPPPPPPAPAVQKITLASKALFDFDKAVLRPEGKAAIDTESSPSCRACEARAGAGDRPHRPRSARSSTTRSCPSAVPTPSATTWSAEGRAEGQDRDARHGQDAAGSGRRLQAEEHEGADRLPRAESPRRSRSQGRRRRRSNRSRSSQQKPRVVAGLFFRGGRNRTTCARLPSRARRANRGEPVDSHRNFLDCSGALR